jgi:transposase InsO family protein
VLYVFLVLAHERRKILHFNITEAPSALWAAQQMGEAFPYTTPPRYLLRDRDGIYGTDVVRRVQGLGLEQKLIAPQAPWQNPMVERLIGSIRRERLDHVIILNAHHLRRTLSDYLAYYHQHRPHSSLDQDCPLSRHYRQLTSQHHHFASSITVQNMATFCPIPAKIPRTGKIVGRRL